MSYKYKDEIYNSLNLVSKLIDDYGTCPGCGSERIGSSKNTGSMDYNGKLGTFERICKCGWSVKLKVEKI